MAVHLTATGRRQFGGATICLHQVVSGQGRVTTAETNHLLVGDGYLIVNQGSDHTVMAVTDPVITIEIHPSCLNGLRFEECLAPRDFLVDRAVSRALELGPSNNAANLLAEGLRQAHGGIGQEYHLSERRGTELGRTMRLARAFILGHLPAPLSVPKVADRVAWSASHFHRGFSMWHGVTPARYIATERVRRACRLLVLTDESVASISEACGYLSSTSFVRAFHAVTTCTPSEFRDLRQHHRAELPFFARALQFC